MDSGFKKLNPYGPTTKEKGIPAISLTEEKHR